MNVGVIGRVIAPPALPGVVPPFTAFWTKHVPAKDEGAETVHRAFRKSLIHAFRAAFVAEHGPERPGSDEPAVQFRAALSEGVLKALIWAGSVTIDGY